MALAMGMAPSGFADALGRKYAILGQQAANQGVSAQAQMVGARAQDRTSQAQSGLLDQQASQVSANAAAQRELEGSQTALTGAQAGQVAPNAASMRALQGSQTALTGAQASDEPANAASMRNLQGSQSLLEREQAGQVGPNAESMRNLNTAQGKLEGQQGDYYGAMSGGMGPLDRPGSDMLYQMMRERQMSGVTPGGGAPAAPGYADGTAYVPGLRHYADGTAGVGTNALTPAFTMQEQANNSIVPHPISQPSNPITGGLGIQTAQFAGGTTRVPGHGSGMVDKVPAVLAPGEAVLNKGAAEHMGRDHIAALNAFGHAKMIQEAGSRQAPAPQKDAPRPAPRQPPAAPAAKAPPATRGASGKSAPVRGKYPPPRGGKPQELSRGTHEVKTGKSASTPKIDPGALQALMGMFGGGGGQVSPMGGGGPAPGGPPAMPPRGGMV